MRLGRYVIADLVRNPRRTLAVMAGVTLGVGLFCGVLFFVDGLSASMTQRAVAPLAIDMQRIVDVPTGGSLRLTQTFEPTDRLSAGATSEVVLEIRNTSDVGSNDVTIRSLLDPDLVYVPGSARLDGDTIDDQPDNPFAHGPAQAGFNLGTLGPGQRHVLGYAVTASTDVDLGAATVRSSQSSRESVRPAPANEPPPSSVGALADLLATIEGVAVAAPLSMADLGPDTLEAGAIPITGPARIFGFDAGYAQRDPGIDVVEGRLADHGAVISAEAARAGGLAIGDRLTAILPDTTRIDLDVVGIADLSRARSLFTSRRGGDLETFLYVPNSVVVSPETFAGVVAPAFNRAASAGTGRLKSPPIQEVDIAVDRERLDADPGTALTQTHRIADKVRAELPGQGYVLDNISNTLEVATADAAVAKRLFVVLGVPGGLLAAALSAYAGAVLAGAQRRERATLRVRGASRRHLLGMLALRTSLLTLGGSVVGLALGYLAAVAVLGQASLARASSSDLVRSGLVGTSAGFLATGIALYVTGRRSIDRQINDDRAALWVDVPFWRRARLDVVGIMVVVAGTAVALGVHAFDGATGSVYYGKGVRLNLTLLVLPITVWITGCLAAARTLCAILARRRRSSSPTVGPVLGSLYRFSVGRRPWEIGNGMIIVGLIVALATCLAAFTTSYDHAKTIDARYATGADIRITPSPTATRQWTAADAGLFATAGVAATSPVIYGPSNVILRSQRTSDPANLAAADPGTYAATAPLVDADFAPDSAADALGRLQRDPSAVLISHDMAAFLQVGVGDRLDVLLARATDDQVETTAQVAGLFERLPGFPDGADALMSISRHTDHVPSKQPDFFLAATTGSDDAGLDQAVRAIAQGPGRGGGLHIESRASTRARDQSSLAALNIAGLTDLDSLFSLAMIVATIAIFVFGLLLQRRREYVVLRAQGVAATTVRLLIASEAATVAFAGTLAGLVVGTAMGAYFVAVLRPLFVLAPSYSLSVGGVVGPVLIVGIATTVSVLAASQLVARLQPAELLRDD